MTDTIITSTEWTHVHIPIDEQQMLAIAIIGTPEITIGRPALDVDGDELALPIRKTEAGYEVSGDDVPPSTLTIPLKAVTPISTDSVTVSVVVNGTHHDIVANLRGRARFLPQRCKWTTQPTGFGETTTATLRIRNDGQAKTRGLTACIQLPGDLRIRAEEHALEQSAIILGNAGVPELQVRLPDLAVGEAIDLPLSVTRTTTSQNAVPIVATIAAVNIEHDPLRVEATVNTQPIREATLTIEPENTHLVRHERTIATLTLHNGPTHLQSPALTIMGEGIETIEAELGPIFPYEYRSWPVQLVTTKADAGPWTVEVTAAIKSGSDELSAACIIAGEGNPVLTLDTSFGTITEQLALPITARIVNVGLGTAVAPLLGFTKIPDVVAIIDSLTIDDEGALENDGSVPIFDQGIKLPDIQPGESCIVAFEIRAATDMEATLEGFVQIEGMLHDRTLIDGVSLPSAKDRKKKARGRAETPTTTAASPSPATTNGKRHSNGNATNNGSATTGGKTPPTAPPSTNTPVYRYPDQASPDMLMLVPNVDVEIGRYVLGLYGCLPTHVENDDERNQRLQDLRGKANELVARGVKGVENGAFGAAGYYMATESLGASLNAVLADLELAPVDPTDEKALVLAMLALAGGEDDYAHIVTSLRDRIVSAVTAIQDEEEYGNTLEEAA